MAWAPYYYKENDGYSGCSGYSRCSSGFSGIVPSYQYWTAYFNASYCWWTFDCSI